MIELYPHQIDVLEKSKDLNRVAYFYDMGTGKTYIGSSKMHSLGNRVNLLVCQKSKVKDWLEHFKAYYSEYTIKDLTKNKVLRPAWEKLCILQRFWLSQPQRPYEL